MKVLSQVSSGETEEKLKNIRIPGKWPRLTAVVPDCKCAAFPLHRSFQ